MGKEKVIKYVCRVGKRPPSGGALEGPGSRKGVVPVTVDVSVQADSENRSSELIKCFRHEDEGCPRCDGSGFRPRKYCTGCGVPAGRPSQGGKALIGLRNRRGWDQPFYCLGCHPELGRGLPILEKG